MDEFIKKVKEMREAQVSYFRARRQQNTADADHFLLVSKKMEREVDEFIQKHEQDKVQPKLFW